MKNRPVTTLLGLLAIVFVGVLGFFYIQEGSFEGAGERMDVVMDDLGDEVLETGDEIVETTNDVVEDLSDGKDDVEGTEDDPL